MHKNEFKDQAYELISSVARAIGNPHRLEILELLANGRKSVENIARETRMTVGNASQHLQRLKQYNLLKSKRSATTIFYSLSDKSVLSLIRSLHQTAHSQINELAPVISQFRKPYGTNKAKVSLVPNDCILLDVRSEFEFNHHHKKGAINIPHYKLKDSMKLLSKSKVIVAYCRGELCTYADEVVKQLNKAGYNAVRLDEYVMMRSA